MKEKRYAVHVTVQTQGIILVNAENREEAKKKGEENLNLYGIKIFSSTYRELDIIDIDASERW